MALGRASGARSSSPDALASKACPTPPRFAAALTDALPDRPFTVSLWDGTEVPTTGTDGPTFTARSPQALAHVLRAPGQLGLGRAYVSGALDVDDLDAVVRLLDHWEPPADRPPPQGAPDASPRRAPPASCARRRRPRPS